MLYREYAPDPLLSAHIDAYWTLTHTQEDVQQQIILPDGCMDIIFNFGATCKTSSGSQTLQQGRTYLVGTMTRFTGTEMPPGTDLLGIRFRPASIQQFFSFGTICEITDQTIGIQSPFDFDGDPRSKPSSQFLNNFLGRRMSSSRNEFRQVIDVCIAARGLISVKQLAAHCCISLRQLERKFLQQTGIHPKQFISIIRNRAAMAAIKSKKADTTLLEIALDFGFYDHAHLSNEIKKFSGRVPSAI
ncbi:helix-turn-helix domain-containing protein [Pseudoflavitalea sp. G-6-1-2]|nr:helix-turn-helix domain-containing protein [Pseudoflavitalea sp. G-6-1-2]